MLLQNQEDTILYNFVFQGEMKGKRVIMRKRIFVFVLAICMIFNLSSCSKTNNTVDNKDDDVIRIGYIGPLTGEGVPWGSAEINGLNMIVEELNAQGGIMGKKIQVYSYDNRMDNVETTNAARKAIVNDKVVAIIGCNASSNSIALANVCEEYKVPHIATTSTNPMVTVKEDGTVRPYSFRVTITDPQLGTVMGKFASSTLKAKTAAVLYEIGSDYSMGLKDNFIETFKENGGEVQTVEAYKTGDVDFRAQLTKIKEGNPDVIFLPALYKEIALATNQARDLGIQSTFLGGDTWVNTDLFTLAPEAVEGSYYVTYFNNTDPEFDDYKEKYEEKYGYVPGGEGANSFFITDIMLLLADVIEKEQSIDPEKIRDGLENAEGVKGLTSELTINKEDHNPINPAVIFKVLIDPDRFEYIDSINP